MVTKSSIFTENYFDEFKSSSNHRKRGILNKYMLVYKYLNIYLFHATYIGKTKPSLQQSMKEHQRAIKYGNIKQYEIADNCWEQNHLFDWISKEILDYERYTTNRLIKESIYSAIYTNHINRVSCERPEIWLPNLKTLKKSTHTTPVLTLVFSQRSAFFVLIVLATTNTISSRLKNGEVSPETSRNPTSYGSRRDKLKIMNAEPTKNLFFRMFSPLYGIIKICKRVLRLQSRHKPFLEFQPT